MKSTPIIAFAASTGLAIAGGQLFAGADHKSGSVVGPDVTVHGIGIDGSEGSFRNYGPVGDYRAYAVATVSCNQGDMEVNWSDGTQTFPSNQHPVIAQNMYRIKDGRFEHIGMSWLKHGFCALDGDACGTCEGNINCDLLGVGCSDPYNAQLNGEQVSLGPRSEVNSFTGFFPFPPNLDPAIVDDTSRRLRVRNADVAAGGDLNTQFIIEVQYVNADDSLWSNQYNNVSHRRAVLAADGAISGFFGPTLQQPAIFAWQAADPSVVISEIDRPGAGAGDGCMYLGSRAAPAGGGVWRYDYTIYNMNSDRSARSFELPMPASISVTDLGFRDIEHHSGEPYSGNDWPGVLADSALRWETQTFAANPNANALRWGTAYSFRFTADAPPRTVDAAIDLFKGAPTTVTAAALAPTPDEDVTLDGLVNQDDLMAVLQSWGNCLLFGCGREDINGDGFADVFDLLAVLDAWGS